ncbi:restriction endonuclease subunit S [Bacteroides pyogenes]|uniref:restriction endonuclease subunit S n=1 Tax=Bacteroides pyogenes TaxID=310300 RepID=UPI0037357A4C
MTKELKHIPNLRFPEFKNSGEWELKALSKITSSIFDGTHQTPQYVDKGVPFFSVENLVSNAKNRFISQDDYNIATAKNKPEKGDILLTRIGNIGFSSIVSWDYDFSIYVTLACIKSSSSFNSYFLHSFFQTNWYQKEITSKSLLTAVPCKINMRELKSTKVLLPPSPLSIKEQSKIAECLSSLDNYINATQEKIELLQSYKKGLMQHLFPILGEDMPKLRFPKFKKPKGWKIVKLKTICHITNGKANTQDHHKNGKYPLFDRSAITKASDEYIFDAEAVIIPGEGVRFIPKYYNGKFNLHQRAYALKDFTCNALFVYYIMQQKESLLAQKAVQSTVLSLRLPILQEFPIELPTDIDEQKEIAECLASIDDLIDTTKQKLVMLQNHKRGLMQQLFPTV